MILIGPFQLEIFYDSIISISQQTSQETTSKEFY